MFIVVESGSTKTDWMVVHTENDVVHYETSGINPSTQNTLIDLKEYKELAAQIQKSDKIYYYGAGVIDTLTENKIKDLVQNVGFKGTIFVHSDLVAAARSCFGMSEGIICILGTGSIAGFFDGHKIIPGSPSLGYILGDEGGGVSIGAQVIKDYFHKEMPDDIRSVFEQKYNITRETVLQKLYREPYGNKYLATFASFLTCVEGDWKENLIKEAFRAFIKIHLLKPFTPIQKPIKFVGSIAFYHQQLLKDVLKEFGLTAEEIIQKPIYKLIDFHLEKK